MQSKTQYNLLTIAGLAVYALAMVLFFLKIYNIEYYLTLCGVNVVLAYFKHRVASPEQRKNQLPYRIAGLLAIGMLSAFYFFYVGI